MATISVRVDDSTKQAAAKLFSELGLDTSTAINMFLKRALIERGIPFEVSLESPNALTAKVLADSERGVDVHGPYNSVEEFWEALNAED